MRRFALSLMVVSLVLGVAGNSLSVERGGLAYADAQSGPGTGNRPQTIPALRAWLHRPGEFVLGEVGRIVIAPGQRSKGLADTAKLLVGDIRALTGAEYRVEANSSSSRPGDIRLVLGPPDSQLGEEGYELEVGEAIAVTAPTRAGVFYGTRTILQLLRQDRAVPAGVARDWPRYPERGLMVDIGRKHFTPEWLEAHVRELAYLKMNYLHLHLSDDLGFRVESETHPEIVSDPHLTKEQMRALIDVAERHHVTVVPEIDMPGHMGAALASHPELQLANALGQRHPSRLDITNPEALRFARDLIEEYLPLFPGPYWHTGADEFLPASEYPLHPQLESYAREQYGPDANAKDAIHGFVNRVDEIVRAHGKTTRMWNDDMKGSSAVTINPAIVAEWWTDIAFVSDSSPPGPQELLDRGHQIMNAGWYPTYYVETGRPDVRTAYESWSVHEFAGFSAAPANTLLYGAPERRAPGVELPPQHIPPPQTIAPDEPRNLGSKIHVWMDNPDYETEAQVAAGIAPRLRMLAQKTWQSPLLTDSYSEFQSIMEDVGHAPGYEF